VEIRRVYEVLLRGVRRRRMERFAAAFSPTPSTRILDVGGSPFNWGLSPVRGRVTLLNVSPPRERGDLPERFALVTASGTDLPHRDRAFDIAFSNSVIEHLRSYGRQARFAAELRRVGRRLWVQTPARSFFFEPHLLTPFVHWLPKAWQRRLLRHATVWGWLARPGPAQVERFLRETRLLSYTEMRALFPDCEIHRERFLLMTKSYVAVRRRE
jgi:hypothetical protein